MGIEPTQSAWKAEVLPLNYTRSAHQPAAIKSPEITRPVRSGQPAISSKTACMLPAGSSLAHQLLDVRDDPTPLRYSLVLVEGEGFEPSKA